MSHRTANTSGCIHFAGTA